VINYPYQINKKPSLYYSILPVLKKLVIVPILILFLDAYAQEPSFTQYLAAPNLLNPATTGLYNGKYQFQSNLKNQWSQVMYPYQTGVIDAQAHVLDGYIGANDIFSVSFLGSLDKSNDGGYKKSQVGGTLSYHKSLDGEGLNHLGIGVQAIYNNVTLDYTRLTFQSQFQPYIGYDPTINNGEGAGFTTGAFDFSTGVLYSYFDEDINAYLGAGAFHLNNPPIQMPTGSFSIPTRLTFHGGLSFPVSELDRLYSSLSHQKSTVTNLTTLGVLYGKNLNGLLDEEANELLFGGFLRFKDAFTPYIGYRKGGISGGISYDITTSELRKAGNLNGSLEVVFQIRLSEAANSEQIKKLKCNFTLW
jgi:type IX secretion system PorP/SprF family membrane protein